jgi:hypothetical protein
MKPRTRAILWDAVLYRHPDVRAMRLRRLGIRYEGRSRLQVISDLRYEIGRELRKAKSSPIEETPRLISLERIRALYRAQPQTSSRRRYDDLFACWAAETLMTYSGAEPEAIFLTA